MLYCLCLQEALPKGRLDVLALCFGISSRKCKEYMYSDPTSNTAALKRAHDAPFVSGGKIRFQFNNYGKSGSRLAFVQECTAQCARSRHCLRLCVRSVPTAAAVEHAGQGEQHINTTLRMIVPLVIHHRVFELLSLLRPNTRASASLPRTSRVMTLQLLLLR